MTPATDLVQCANCDGLFTSASSDDVFYHATCRCRRDAPPASPRARVTRAEIQNGLQLSPDN
jgi:hypothetical protein